jgi:hypothetical protein
MNDSIKVTVFRHIVELREMAANGEITDKDHDLVGRILRDHISHLIDLSPKAWAKFQNIVDESRVVQQHRNDTRNRERMEPDTGGPCIRREPIPEEDL